jgi:hypothetical protein
MGTVSTNALATDSIGVQKVLKVDCSNLVTLQLFLVVHRLFLRQGRLTVVGSTQHQQATSGSRPVPLCLDPHCKKKHCSLRTRWMRISSPIGVCSTRLVVMVDGDIAAGASAVPKAVRIQLRTANQKDASRSRGCPHYDAVASASAV